MFETKAINRSILVVDDEKSICDILSSYLNRKGFTVYQAYNGESAINVIRDNDVDLVLSDIKMPGMSGVEFLQWVKEHNSFLPVIMTTGFPTLDTAVEALKLGAHDYLTKPFHLEEIFEKILRALQTRQLEEDHLLFSRLVSLHEVTKVLASTHSLDELNERLLDYSVKMSKAQGGALFFVTATSKLNIVKTSSLPYDKNFWSRQLFVAASQWVVSQSEPLILEATSHHLPPQIPPLPPTIQSYIIFPLKTSKGMLGALNLVRMKDCGSFSNVELEIINVLSSQASIAIENARLYQDLRDNYLKTISGFALAVEAKDKYTHGHSENVMKFTIVLAKQLGLSPKEMEQIKYAGLLHDIGKIGIDESILNKPGKLTYEEFEQIKRHPDLGARILSNVPFFESLIPLIRHHHEYFNGAGYPDGLKGEDIPYGARILSVSDAFEAMTSDRPYRKAMPKEMALDILKNERGRQFDPGIVDAFIEVMKR
ncbi:MAG: response regulator [Chitinivibrionales bacterium]|nr:response regulator [Chitinivibrionales bacterium]